MFTNTFHGLRDWVLQRGTAMMMAFYAAALLSMMIYRPPVQFEIWKSFFAPLWMKVATLLFFLSLVIHAWIGMKDVLMDYIKSPWLRLSIQSVTLLSLLFYVVWTVRILWGLNAY